VFITKWLAAPLFGVPDCNLRPWPLGHPDNRLNPAEWRGETFFFVVFFCI
jgi:hypothetical protein